MALVKKVAKVLQKGIVLFLAPQPSATPTMFCENIIQQPRTEQFTIILRSLI